MCESLQAGVASPPNLIWCRKANARGDAGPPATTRLPVEPRRRAAGTSFPNTATILTEHLARVAHQFYEWDSSTQHSQSARACGVIERHALLRTQRYKSISRKLFKPAVRTRVSAHRVLCFARQHQPDGRLSTSRAQHGASDSLEPHVQVQLGISVSPLRHEAGPPPHHHIW